MMHLLYLERKKERYKEIVIKKLGKKHLFLEVGITTGRSMDARPYRIKGGKGALRRIAKGKGS